MTPQSQAKEILELPPDILVPPRKMGFERAAQVNHRMKAIRKAVPDRVIRAVFWDNQIDVETDKRIEPAAKALGVSTAAFIWRICEFMKGKRK